MATAASGTAGVTVDTDPNAFAGDVSFAGLACFNIHSTVFRGGEIRGRLVTARPAA